MLIIDTFLGLTKEKGLGLFSNDFLKKGTTYWIRNEKFDKIIYPDVLNCFHQLQQEFIIKYGFLEITGNWYLCTDNGKYCNHSDHPNTSNIYDANGLLLKCQTTTNIEKNSEILCNYKELCQSCRIVLPF